jgi:hypothetical protein
MITTAIEKEKLEIEFTSILQARLCSVIMNANGALKSNKKPFEIEDFMPQAKKKKPVLTIEQHKEVMKMAVLKMGGTIN